MPYPFVHFYLSLCHHGLLRILIILTFTWGLEELCFSVQASSQGLAWSPFQNLRLGSPPLPKVQPAPQSDPCVLSQALPPCSPVIVLDPLPCLNITLSPGPPQLLFPWQECSFLLPFFTCVLPSPQVSAQTSLPDRNASLISPNKIFLLNAFIVPCSSHQSSHYT